MVRIFLVFCMPDTNPFCQADVPIKRLSLASVQRCQEFEPTDSKGMLLCLNVLPPQLNRKQKCVCASEDSGTIRISLVLKGGTIVHASVKPSSPTTIRDIWMANAYNHTTSHNTFILKLPPLGSTNLHHAHTHDTFASRRSFPRDP